MVWFPQEVKAMDCQKIGILIRTLRLEQHMTQQALAEQLCLSPKTVSKWERGLGCPDLSVLSDLSAALGVGLEALLQGDLGENSPVAGNMKKINFYVCPVCGSVTASTGQVALSCCGMTLEAQKAQKAGEEDKLRLEQVEDEWFITTDHPMTKQCYISFLALATGESLQIIKCYPEWELQVRLPRRRHGTLYFYSTEKGLLYQYI